MEQSSHVEACCLLAKASVAKTELRAAAVPASEARAELP